MRVTPPRLGTGLPRTAVLVGYLVLSLLFYTRGADWTHGLLTAAGGDAWSFVWFLNWWPWAFSHGQDALRSAFVYAPDGYDLPWATSLPTASLLSLPVTLAFGANVSFNLLSVLAPGLDAFCAFLLVRQCGGTMAASVLGGLLYGFSPYEIGQLLGHLNLDLTFPVPLACLLVVARSQQRIGPRAFIAGLAATLLAEFGLSTEVFASSCCFGVLGWLLFVLLSRQPMRTMLLRVGAEGLAALVLVAIVVSPWLVRMAEGAGRIPGFINPPWVYSANLLNLVVPTQLTLLGGQLFAPVSGHFSGNLSEQGSYIGLPLLIILGLLARERHRERAVLALLLLVAALAVASLGPSLHVGRWDSRVPLPWWFALHLPLLKGALPGRFSLYVVLAISVAAACWQAGAATLRGRRQRLAALAVAVLVLAPTPAAVCWSTMPVLPFFRPDRIAALGRDRTVLILPYLSTENGATPAMLWQWQSGMRFRQTGGYLSFVPYPDSRLLFVQQLMRGERGGDFANDLSAYVDRAGATAVIAGPGTTPALLAGLRAMGWAEQDTGGVALFRVPPADTLRYAALYGEAWPDVGSSSWLGRSGLVVTHGRSVTLHLTSANLPLPATTVTVAAGDRPPVTYRIAAHGSLDIPLPADGRYRIVPGATFRPGVVWHTPDTRTLSFIVSLQPT